MKKIKVYFYDDLTAKLPKNLDGTDIGKKFVFWGKRYELLNIRKTTSYQNIYGGKKYYPITSYSILVRHGKKVESWEMRLSDKIYFID